MKACPLLISTHKPKWWCLENPRGYLRRWLGEPDLTIEPWMFKDMYQKKTDLWGMFTEPKRLLSVKPKNLVKFSMLKSRDIHPEFYGKLSRQERRAITPQGFAKAFYEANK